MMTRIFGTCLEAHGETKRTLFEMGTRNPSDSVQDKAVAGDPDYEMLELRGYDFKISDIASVDQFIDELSLSREYIDAEFGERVYGQWANPGGSWRHREEVWKPFLEKKTGKFAYTYNERMSQALQIVLRELEERPNSRQCVVPVFWPADVYSLGGVRRIPCSMFYQFVRRRGELELYYVMRSCDFMTHFPYDLALAIRLQQHAARYLQISTSFFHMYIISLHAFVKDLKGVF